MKAMSLHILPPRKIKWKPIHYKSINPRNYNNTAWRSKLTLSSSNSSSIVLSSIAICSSIIIPYKKCLLEEQTQEKHIIIPKNKPTESILNTLWTKLKHCYKYLKQTIIILLRGTEILLVCLPIAFPLLPLSYTNITIINDLLWNYTISILEYLGPSYVKLGQWASTRRDLFSPELCNQLGRLQCNTRIHDWKYTQYALTQSFGDYESKGLLITSSSPILGSGAVAQVYKGYLVNYGPVAIKVLHPNISYKIERDLYLMESIGHFLQTYILPNEIKPCMDIPTIMENIAGVLRSQVDLTIEGRNLVRFCDNFQRLHYEDVLVNFPSVVKEWVSPTVLVEDLVVDAQPISSIINTCRDDDALRMKLAQPLFHAFLKMLFLDNFFHCDLHPGNILISTTKASPKHSFYTKVANNSPRTTITFLDAGLTHSLSLGDFQNLKDLFLAIVLNDGRTAGELMISRARNHSNKHTPSPTDILQFSQGIQEIVSDFHDQKLASIEKGSNLTLSTIQIGSLLTRVLDLCRRYKVEMDPCMVNVVVSVIVLEGLGRSLDPDLDLMDCALPFLIEATTC